MIGQIPRLPHWVHEGGQAKSPTSAPEQVGVILPEGPLWGESPASQDSASIAGFRKRNRRCLPAPCFPTGSGPTGGFHDRSNYLSL